MLARPLRNNEQSDQGRWLCFTHHYCTIDTRLILASCHHACTGLGVWPRSQHHEDIVPKTLPLKQHLSNRVIALHEVACKAQCIVQKKPGDSDSDSDFDSDYSDSASEVKWSHWITEAPPHCLSNHLPSSTEISTHLVRLVRSLVTESPAMSVVSRRHESHKKQLVTKWLTTGGDDVTGDQLLRPWRPWRDGVCCDSRLRQNKKGKVQCCCKAVNKAKTCVTEMKCLQQWQWPNSATWNWMQHSANNDSMYPRAQAQAWNITYTLPLPRPNLKSQQLSTACSRQPAAAALRFIITAEVVWAGLDSTPALYTVQRCSKHCSSTASTPSWK